MFVCLYRKHMIWTLEINSADFHFQDSFSYIRQLKENTFMGFSSELSSAKLRRELWHASINIAYHKDMPQFAHTVSRTK